MGDRALREGALIFSPRPSSENFPNLSTKAQETPGAATKCGPGGCMFLGFPWGKLSSAARLMRGMFSSHVPSQHSWPATAKNLPPASFLHAMAPHPSALRAATFPQGEGLKTTLLSRTRQRPSGAKGTTCRTDAPVLIPLLRAVDLLLKREPASRATPKDFSLGVWGGVSFPREKKYPPELRTSRRARR